MAAKSSTPRTIFLAPPARSSLQQTRSTCGPPRQRQRERTAAIFPVVTPNPAGRGPWSASCIDAMRLPVATASSSNVVKPLRKRWSMSPSKRRKRRCRGRTASNGRPCPRRKATDPASSETSSVVTSKHRCHQRRRHVQGRGQSTVDHQVCVGTDHGHDRPPGLVRSPPSETDERLRARTRMAKATPRWPEVGATNSAPPDGPNVRKRLHDNTKRRPKTTMVANMAAVMRLARGAENKNAKAALTKATSKKAAHPGTTPVHGPQRLEHDSPEREARLATSSQMPTQDEGGFDAASSTAIVPRTSLTVYSQPDPARRRWPRRTGPDRSIRLPGSTLAPRPPLGEVPHR